MADRVSVSITIGGSLAAALRDQFVALNADHGLAPDWDGYGFDVSQLPEDGPLIVCAHEVPWGMLPSLEGFCVEHRLPFVLQYDAYTGQWNAGRTVFRCYGEPESYACDEEGNMLVDRGTVVRLASIAAILALFDAADFVVPPLRLTG